MQKNLESCLEKVNLTNSKCLLQNFLVIDA